MMLSPVKGDAKYIICKTFYDGELTIIAKERYLGETRYVLAICNRKWPTVHNPLKWRDICSAKEFITTDEPQVVIKWINDLLHIYIEAATTKGSGNYPEFTRFSVTLERIL